jgi:hypothetical protein
LGGAVATQIGAIAVPRTAAKPDAGLPDNLESVQGGKCNLVWMSSHFRCLEAPTVSTLGIRSAAWLTGDGLGTGAQPSGGFRTRLLVWLDETSAPCRMDRGELVSGREFDWKARLRCMYRPQAAKAEPGDLGRSYQ